MMRIYIALITTLLCSSTLWAATKTEQIVKGCVNNAYTELSKDASSEKGIQLLEFALALDADNAQGLLLKAKLEKDLPISAKKPGINDTELIKLLDSLSESLKRIKKTEKSLLYKYIITLFDEDNEKALIDLMGAQNKGYDTSFHGLLEAASSTKASVSTKKPKSKSSSRSKKVEVNDLIKVKSRDASGAVSQLMAEKYYFKKREGAPNVLYIHPFSETEPSSVDFSAITKEGRGRITLYFKSYTGYDCIVNIKSDGDKPNTFTVKGDKWIKKSISYDSNEVVVEGHAGGNEMWNFEYLYMGYSVKQR